MSSASSESTYLVFQGKIAIVTGASRGIGASIAYEFARRGAYVMITYTSSSSAPKVEVLISKITALANGSRAASIASDLRQLGAPQKIIDATFSAFGVSHIDVLINNAGVFMQKPSADVTAQDFADVHDLNVRGTFMMTQVVAPHLRAPGRIINVSSVAGRLGLAGLSVYASSKAAIEALARVFAAELGPKGHTVNAVAPGPTASEMLDLLPKDFVEAQKQNTPVEHRLGQPEDIAGIVMALCGEEGRWISGQTISASGGILML
ncbi:NAD(P)-binding protein [Fistulina hepatica ATCC 64428]|uniref:NAD(P)-binding protein n=1 Tax=Fistulina hepatica ATCC 64428 TaxID=1128425 RepID=A0A0D7AJA3_9AGAR|nr:NAD(P)-binding protein [Fistulina hepatica ATCC 64428]